MAPVVKVPSLEGTSALSDEDADGDVATVTPDGAADKAEREPSHAEVSPTPEIPPKVALLKEILKSRNDNDPRLDKELRVLTPKERQQMRQFYRELPAEARNSKGTAVFLLGRNLERPEDFKFMADVVGEPSCLSLSNCAVADALTTGADDHDQSTAVTLAYPQIVALKSVERLLQKNGGVGHRREIDAILAAARKSENPRIRQMANALRR